MCASSSPATVSHVMNRSVILHRQRHHHLAAFTSLKQYVEPKHERPMP